MRGATVLFFWRQVISTGPTPVDFIGNLPLDAARHISSFLPSGSFRSFTTSSRALYELRLGHELPLTCEHTMQYIEDVDGFRAHVDATMRSPQVQLRFNLGEHVVRFVVDPAFRELVSSLVENPREQIFSDVDSLQLDGEDIADLAGLASVRLPNLRFVSLTSCPALRDISQLRAFPAIEELYLRDSPVWDIRPLERLTNLSILSLSETQVDSIEPLRDLVSLETLYLCSTPLGDIAPLEELVNLQRLGLGGLDINHIPVLRRLVNLRMLSLHGTPVEDFAPLWELVNLEELYLETTDVSDLGFINNMPHLTQVDLRATQVSQEDVLALRALRPDLDIQS